MAALDHFLAIQPEVEDALAAGRPVVALESTIISHGMPYPQNVETARAVEAEIRAGGAVPATIAVLDGRIRVGLDDDDLDLLARHGAVRKLSRRDLPVALATGEAGATTVAATMICADLAGIRVFVTGGIGGVHRGAETSLDISADLEELARTSVAVVCAGAKAILDLPKTLEYLETRGVPVIGYGTDRLPAFYTRDSGLAVDQRADDPQTVARIMQMKWRLGLEGGLIVANPIPEADALDPAAIDGAIAQALAEAAERGIGGKAVTPFLLSRLGEITGGSSLKANIALILNNARVGAAIAVAHAAAEAAAKPPAKPAARMLP
ncbi:MAG TPA: pseudouridine-5'-phosphate glycosidase [Alphaproteobacteria bacterium]|nr:pseudouridine-5'-phosphate glycosidase [Alphaproteobacteria bacterium]